MKTFNTINIVQHLKSKHIDEFRKYLREQAGRIALQQTNKKQLTLKATEDCMKLWKPSDPRAQRIVHHVSEMVILACQPLSMVEDTGLSTIIYGRRYWISEVNERSGASIHDA